MNTKDIITSYVRSPLGIGVAGGSLVLALAAMLWGGVPAALSLGGMILLYTIASGLLLLTRRGASSIVKEQDYLRFLKVSERIQEASDIRDKVSFIRIADAELAESVQYFLLVSGQYLDSCRKEHLYDPVANDALSSVLSLIQGFLSESDETSVEKRFKLPDDNPVPDVESRTISAIREAAAVIKERRIAIDGGMNDILSAREELPK